MLGMKSSNGYWRIHVAAGMVFAAGCGLSEYESKYEKQQERMNYLDQQDQYLGRPVTLPDKKNSNEPRVSVRLPLGISTNHEEEPVGILNRYPKSSSKALQGDKAKISEIDSVFLAVETTKNWKEFKKRALEPFKGVEPQDVRLVSLEIPGRPPRNFETIAFTDGTEPTWAYRFYFFQDKGCGVALGFRGTEGALASETARQAMEFSVKTLTVDTNPVPATKSSGG
jgi:hypothetical protein